VGGTAYVTYGRISFHPRFFLFAVQASERKRNLAFGVFDIF